MYGELTNIQYFNPIANVWQSTVPTFSVDHWNGLACRGVNLTSSDKSMAFYFYAYGPTGVERDRWTSPFYVIRPGQGLTGNFGVYCDVPGDYTIKCDLVMWGVGTVDTVTKTVCYVTAAGVNARIDTWYLWNYRGEWVPTSPTLIPFGEAIGIRVRGTNNSTVSLKMKADVKPYAPSGARATKGGATLTVGPGEYIDVLWDFKWAADEGGDWTATIILYACLVGGTLTEVDRRENVMVASGVSYDVPAKPTFSVSKPTADPASAPPGTVLITCPVVVSNAPTAVSFQVKCIVYEGSILPGAGTKLWEKTQTVSYASGARTVQFAHPSVTGTIDRRDVGVEIYYDGVKVKDGQWDDVFYVTLVDGEPPSPPPPGGYKGTIESLNVLLGKGGILDAVRTPYSPPVLDVTVGYEFKLKVVAKNTSTAAERLGLHYVITKPDGSTIDNAVLEAWPYTGAGKDHEFIEPGIAALKVDQKGKWTLKVELIADSISNILDTRVTDLFTDVQEAPPSAWSALGDMIPLMIIMMMMTLMMEQTRGLYEPVGAPPRPKPVTEAVVKGAKRVVGYTGKAVKRVTEYFREGEED